MNNNTQESKIQLEYINKCTELVKEKYEKAPAFFIQNAGCQMNSLQTAIQKYPEKKMQMLSSITPAQSGRMQT